MENNTRKWILIPEYKPLWAMRECFGPTHGPLDKPCPTALDIIGKLLRQTGPDKLTVMEVLDPKTGPCTPVQLTLDNYTLPYHEILKGATIEKTTTTKIADPPSDPVPPVIDASNKKVAGSIADMLNGKKADPEPEKAPEADGEPAEEEDADKGEEPVAESLPEVHGDTGAITPEQAAEALGVDAVPGEPAPEKGLDETHTAEEIQEGLEAGGEGEQDDPEEESKDDSAEADPYKGMTKAQRRAARKAAEAAAKQNN